MANKSTGKTSSTKKASTAKSTKKTTGRASSRTTVNSEPKEVDPFFSEAQVDIALIAVIALGVLLMLANFGLGGIIGKTVAGFLFGLFGIIQYLLPIAFVIGVFFSIANKKNKVAIAKEIAAFIFIIFVSVIAELLVHGNAPMKALEAFSYAKEFHNGGGLIGGFIGGSFIKGFGLVVSYFISAIIMIICIILITERFIMGGAKEAMQHRADVAEIKRLKRRDEYELKRQTYIQTENAKREANRAKRKAELEAEAIRQANETGPRANRARNGITTNTTLMPESVVTTTNKTKGNVEEITFNANDIQNIEIIESSRTKLVSNTASSSAHSFDDINNNAPINIDAPKKSGSFFDNVSNNDITAVSAPVIRGVDDNNTVENIVTSPVEKKVTKVAEKKAADAIKPVDTTPAKDNDVSPLKAATESTAKPVEKQSEAAANKPYKFPPLSLLIQPPSSKGDSKDYIQQMSDRLLRTLKNFGVDANVTEVTRGPSVTRYEITIAEGVKVSKVVNLADDIKLNMAVTDLRMEAPIPGKSAIGIEVPNKEKIGVSLAELIKSQEFKTSKSKISFCVGKNITGDIVIGNIEKYPHVLIAGQTGSGKSVCINSIIMSILYHATPDEVKLIMVDPKQVELSVYNGIPHLLLPVVTDPKKAASTLAWACVEMDRRYKLLAKYSVRNLDSYNSKIDSEGNITYTDENGETKEEIAEMLPQIVIILDELADLMMVAGKEVETSICRLAQLARAAGIHLVIATQRPTANVLTGLIKGNVPSRIAFSVASALDSRVILDDNGAESLLGHGDMLYHPSGTNAPVRLQGAFVTDDEINNVVEYIKKNNEPVDRERMQAIQAAVDSTTTNDDSSSGTVSISDGADSGLDPLLAEAGRSIIESGKGSIGNLQRKFRIGFNRAARIVDQLAELGVVGPELGTKPREIKMTMAEFEELLSNL